MGYIHEPFHRKAALRLSWGNFSDYSHILEELRSFGSREVVLPGIPDIFKNSELPGFYFIVNDAPKDLVRRGHSAYFDSVVMGDNISFNQFFYDGPYAFALLRFNGICNYGLACISFSVDGRRSVSIGQLQGKKGRKEELLPVKWEKLLIGVVEDWAERHGTSMVKIASSELNFWKVEKNCKADLCMRYDFTAQQLGYTKNGSSYFKLLGGINCGKLFKYR